MITHMVAVSHRFYHLYLIFLIIVL